MESRCKLSKVRTQLHPNKCEKVQNVVRGPYIFSAQYHCVQREIECPLNRDIVFDVVNPFPSKRFPIDELNRLALDRVKSISALSTHSDGKGLTPSRPNEIAQ